jgi:hypothetical protein
MTTATAVLLQELNHIVDREHPIRLLHLKLLR